MADIVVSDYGTRLTRTRIVRTTDQEYAWLVRNGPDHPGKAPFQVLPDAFDIGARHTGPTRLVLPRQMGGWLRYEAPGQTAAFYLVFAETEEAGRILREAVWGVGSALAQLHSTVTAVAPSLPAPPGIARLSRWFDRGGEGPGDSLRLFEAMLRVVGSNRVHKLREWIEECDFGGERGVLLHGGPSLGCLVPSPVKNREHVLLTGEELCRGRAEFDLGWLLGELAELDMLERRGRMNLPATRLKDVAQQLLHGYEHPVDAPLLGAVSVLRVLTHTHDAASYHVWDETLIDYLAFIAELVDADGAQVWLGH